MKSPRKLAAPWNILDTLYEYNVLVQRAQTSWIFGVTGTQNHLDYENMSISRYCMLVLKAIWPSGLPSWKKSIFGGMGKKETPSTSKHTNMNDAFYPPQKTLPPALMNPSHVWPLVHRLECKYFKIPVGSRFFLSAMRRKKLGGYGPTKRKICVRGPRTQYYIENGSLKKKVLLLSRYLHLIHCENNDVSNIISLV